MVLQEVFVGSRNSTNEDYFHRKYYTGTVELLARSEHVLIIRRELQLYFDKWGGHFCDSALMILKAFGAHGNWRHNF